MRILILLYCAAAIEAGLFDFFSGNKKEDVHEIGPDPGELGGSRGSPHLGEEVVIAPAGAENPNAGEEIHVPSNRVPIRSSKETTSQRTTMATESVTSATSVKRVLPSASEFSPNDDCPSRVDAFCTGPKYSYLFYGGKVYSMLDGKVVATSKITKLFPSGPDSVNAAVYDDDNGIIVLIRDRLVYGFKQMGANTMHLDSSYPKELPSAVFTPNAAIRWHDKRQMLLSNGGKFALYDQNWNKSLMTGRISDYFKGLPDNVKGISKWENGEARVFTKNLAFTYSAAQNSVTGDGVPISVFLKC